MFTQADLELIRSKGLTPDLIRRQLDNFIRGFPFIKLDRPAVPGDGILSFGDQEAGGFINFFEKNKDDVRIMKFVPASGAASRMFRNLFEFREKYTPSEDCINELLYDKGFNSVYSFLHNLEKFAFFEDLRSCMAKDNADSRIIMERQEYGTIIDWLLDPKGLNYAGLPKALLKFHNYPGGARTAAEEHFVEAANYAADKQRTARVHFTLSPEHVEKFTAKTEEVKSKYRKLLKAELDVTWSVQDTSTDILAVDENNEPFRSDDGTILFRPGGHGALLANLNKLDADIVFIKNIDNIVPDRLKDTTYRYKRLTGGYLLFIRKRIFAFLRECEKSQLIEEELDSMALFAAEKCNIDIPADYSGMTPVRKQELLKDLLNRPIRVCGMVKNEGEPGGGPFRVSDEKGGLSLQIVESSQVNHDDPEQENIFNRATHFNPVDLVCCIKDYKGNPFNLAGFGDPSTGFITQKSSEGRILKAQELPGLWNGSMAKWITIFMEVPIITFNPVKTINDLLREEHQ